MVVLTAVCPMTFMTANRSSDESALELRYGNTAPVSKRCVCQFDFWVKSEIGSEALGHRL